MSVNWTVIDENDVICPVCDGCQERSFVYSIGSVELVLNRPTVQSVRGQLLHLRSQAACDDKALNCAFSGMFLELRQRCRPYCLERVFFEDNDVSGNQTGKASIRLMVELGKQPTLGQDFGTHRERLEGIQVCLEQLFLEVFQGLDAAIGLIQRQNDEQRVNPVFFLRKSRKKARRQDQNQVHCEYDSEDVVEVQSKHIAQFLVSFINSYALLIGRVLKIQNLSVFLTPPPELAVAAMDEVAPTRQCYTMLKASIRHYIRSIGGDHILGLSGRDLGLRKGPVTGLFHMDLVFTNDFKRDAVRGANVKKLSDLTGRDADLQYRKLYKRFSYERSYPRSVLIEQIGGISRPNRDSHHYQQDIYSLVQEREYRMSSTAW